MLRLDTGRALRQVRGMRGMRAEQLRITTLKLRGGFAVISKRLAHLLRICGSVFVIFVPEHFIEATKSFADVIQ